MQDWIKDFIATIGSIFGAVLATSALVIWKKIKKKNKDIFPENNEDENHLIKTVAILTETKKELKQLKRAFLIYVKNNGVNEETKKIIVNILEENNEKI
ncbi:hypothetical protein [Mycoplasmopsis synoviae]|uniref:Uncharacterized protein n=1 Tax=Mycoplasmopsis synoviae TaxID=2109 RepID=A0AAX3F0E3_MYCSY|nr:hypothetical protein [Mycoplasmopsis synoviae]UZW64351.1 hypothetical protein OIE46_03205 [Mycoplasmopsis synoviae]